MRDKGIHLYFTDIFDISPKVLDRYRAFNISLVTDLPLFIDPFLLFNSRKKQYQQLHDDIIKYLRFLKDKSTSGSVNSGLLKSWYHFSEIKENWLGFCVSGNTGRGLGKDFARALNENLRNLFADFGSESVTKGSHLEKRYRARPQLSVIKTNSSSVVNTHVKCRSGYFFK